VTGFGTLSALTVHPTSPVLLTRNGPLDTKEFGGPIPTHAMEPFPHI